MNDARDEQQANLQQHDNAVTLQSDRPINVGADRLLARLQAVHVQPRYDIPRALRPAPMVGRLQTYLDHS
jgi:hypothetical protein